MTPMRPIGAYDLKAMAEMFSVSTATIRRGIEAGLIRTIRIRGRVLVPAAEAARIEREGMA